MSTSVLLRSVEEVRHQWRWLLVLGIALVTLGIIALGMIPVATVASAIVFGWLLVVSGIFEAAHGYQVRGSHSMFLHLLGGVLGVLIGLLVVTHPIAGALAWTLLFASFLTVIGLFRTIAAVALKFPHWGWALLDGIITLLLGVSLWASWPASGVWFLGFAVGFALLLRGWSYVMLAFALRRIASPGEIRRAA
jgi:uncharacterized membrane protein HdeD (DUF308 family)